ncbi:YkvA family protein [Deinococcus rubellus]|uniref:YkvA family protein n=1 Tax=Deinococcus rubellus TaxID=1889240 RepID=UPI00337E183C
MNRSPARLNPLRLSARRSSSPLGRLRGVWRDALALLLSLTDRRVGARAKLIAALALLYALSPIDLIPDGIPVLGVTDDLLIVPAVLAYAARSLPAPVLLQARGRVARLPRLWPSALGGVLLTGTLIYALTRLLSQL